MKPVAFSVSIFYVSKRFTLNAGGRRVERTMIHDPRKLVPCAAGLVSNKPLRETLPDDARIQSLLLRLRAISSSSFDANEVCGEEIKEAVELLEMFAKIRLRAERVETLLDELWFDALEVLLDNLEDGTPIAIIVAELDKPRTGVNVRGMNQAGPALMSTLRRALINYAQTTLGTVTPGVPPVPARGS